ncbi:MAG: TetR family transcriptional regulator [Chloroflexi bacterium]|nr:TetR family transcriptional regulator [Chloroflexota bacterium]
MPRGRRPGSSNTRAVILDAARHRFARAGYDHATVRAIAADAGVDPGLVIHFFGSKQHLFREAVGWPIEPSDVIGRVMEVGAEDRPERLARLFVELWENASVRDALLAVLRSALTHEDAARLVQATFQAGLVRKVARAVGGREGELRVELAAAQLLGMAILRYVVRVEPLASAPPGAVIRRLAPALEQHLSPGRSGVAPVRRTDLVERIRRLR